VSDFPRVAAAGNAAAGSRTGEFASSAPNHAESQFTAIRVDVRDYLYGNVVCALNAFFRKRVSIIVEKFEQRR